MDNKTDMALRLLLSFIVGATVTGFSLNSGWQAYRDSPRASYGRWETRGVLKRIDSAIEEYRQQNQSLPRSLGQLPAGPASRLQIQADGTILDGWRRPFLYSREGARAVVLSYGQDGKPGGVGLNADLSNLRPNPPEAKISFKQFVAFAPAMVNACLISGMLAFLLTLVITNNAQFSRRGSIALAIKLIVTLVASALVASFMAMLHIPSGH